MYRETKKFRLDVVVLLMVVLFWLVVFRCSSGEVIVLDDFENGQSVFDWSSDKISTTPTGRSYLGPFGRETVTVRFNVHMVRPDAYSFIDVDVYAIGTWDEFDPWARNHPPYPFIAYQDGRDQPLLVGDLASVIRRTEMGTLGYAEPNRVYHYHQPLVDSGRDWYEIVFTGTVEQWGLDNVQIYTVTPEPSTGTTAAIVLGTLFALWCWWRLRQISRTETHRAKNAAFRRELWLESQKDKGDRR